MSRPARAFTLTELLITIAVIAILIGILIPALRGARAAGGSAKALSNLRGIGVVVQTYLQTYDGVYPWRLPGPTDPGYVAQPPDSEGGAGTLWTSDVWAMRYLWPCVMHDVAPWWDHFRTWQNDGLLVENPDLPWLGGPAVSYHYSGAFLARPEAWTESPPDPGALGSLLRPVRAHEVTSPSAKCLMLDIDRAYLRRLPTADDPRGVLTADGAAALRHDRDAADPFPNHIDGQARRYHDTPGGVRGRDLD